MYVMKNFNKDRKGRYKNPSCDYGPWKGSSHTNQYQIKDNTLQWIGKSDDHDYGIKDCEKVVLKNSRCYLHADPKYIKMVTYIKQCPEDYISAKDYSHATVQLSMWVKTYLDQIPNLMGTQRVEIP